MKTTFLLLQYNNYYNRIIKHEDSVEDYCRDRKYKVIPGLNFNPNDDVNSEHIINWNEDWTPDYCVMLTETNEIHSRWFITEAIRTRGNQYKLTIKRDGVTDYYEKISNAPLYVQKGIIKDSSSPLIYNTENFRVNQIKSDEILLRDVTKVPWLVAYIKKEQIGSPEFTGEIESTLPDDEFIKLTTPIESWKFYDYVRGSANYKEAKQIQAVQIGFRVSIGSKKYRYSFDSFGLSTSVQIDSSTDFGLSLPTRINSEIFRSYLSNEETWLDIEDEFNEKLEFLSRDDETEILTLNGRKIKDSNGKVFQIRLYTRFISSETLNLAEDSQLYSYMNALWNNMNAYRDPLWNEQQAQNAAFPCVGKDILCCSLELEELKEYEATWSGTHCSVTTNTPTYDIICAPYGYLEINYKDEHGNTVAFDQFADISMKFMQSMLKKVGSNSIDLQLLPYCPLQNNAIEDVLVVEDYNQVIEIKEGGNTVGCAFIVPEVDVTFNIPCELKLNREEIDGEYAHSLIEDLKVANECDFYRLCSPNYNGLFEFNIVKNGEVKFFNVDMTLKPFAPYIHVNPNFGGLYGRDYDDARGLVCGGEFTVAYLQDAFQEYEIQNKNYQNIFDRQIQNLEVKRDIEKQQIEWQKNLALVGGILGLAGAGASGSAGGIVGSLAGAAIGYAQAEQRMNWTAQAYKENKDYAIDNFNMSLDNIKAIPLSVMRTNALTYNNKKFAFIEYYTCTDLEKQALRNKMKYDGMNIGVIGTIAEWAGEEEPAFIKGQLIRCVDFDGDNHLLEDIANEIAKGVYI